MLAVKGGSIEGKERKGLDDFIKYAMDRGAVPLWTSLDSPNAKMRLIDLRDNMEFGP
jgi:hypothetical protein